MGTDGLPPAENGDRRRLRRALLGDLFVEVSGDRPFVKAVLDGLRFEES